MPVSFTDPFTIAYAAIEAARRFIKQMEDAAEKNPPTEGSDDLDAYGLFEINCALEIQFDALASFGYILRHAVADSDFMEELQALDKHVRRDASNPLGMEEALAALDIAIKTLDDLTDQLDAEEHAAIEDEHAVAIGALWTVMMARSYLGAFVSPPEVVHEEVQADEPTFVRRGA